MNIGSGAMKCIAYIVLAYALAQTAAFGADLASILATSHGAVANRRACLKRRAAALGSPRWFASTAR